MPAVSLVGVDSAGGLIIGPGSPKLLVNGVPVSLVGDAIASHGKAPHTAAVITMGSTKLTVDGVPVTIAGSPASCGHNATGSAILMVDS